MRNKLPIDKFEAAINAAIEAIDGQPLAFPTRRDLWSWSDSERALRSIERLRAATARSVQLGRK